MASKMRNVIKMALNSLFFLLKNCKNRPAAGGTALGPRLQSLNI